MRNILTLIFILASLVINAQIVGKTTVLKINGDPNLVLGLEDQTGYYESTLAQDTSTGLQYDWKAGRTPVWQETHTAVRTKATPFGLITGTDVEAQIQQVQALIPGIPVSGSNVLFVSKGIGNNATAKVGTNIFPFADPWAARDTAVMQGISNPVIIVTDGSYTYGNATSGADRASNSTLAVSLYRPNHVFYSYPSVSYAAASAGQNDGIGLFTAVDTYGFVAGSFSFLGESTITLGVENALAGWFKLPGSSIRIQANTLVANTGAATPFLCVTRVPEDAATAVNINLGTLELDFKNFTTANNGRIVLVGANTIDTISNFNFNIFVGSVKQTNGFILFNAFGTHHINCSYNVEIGTINGQNSTGYLTNINRVGFINSDFSIKVDFWDATNGTAILGFDQGAPGDASVKGVWRYRLNNVIGGSTRFFLNNANASTELDIYIDANIVSDVDDSTPIIDLNANSYPNVRYFLNIVNLNSKKPLLRTLNTNSEITIYNSIYRGTKYAISATAAGRTAPINVYNSYLAGTVASTITNNTVPINVAQSNFTLTDAGVKNIIREREIGEPVWRSNTFTATASQSTFTTTPAKLPITSANLVVLKNGLEQTDTVDYTYVPSTGVITFIPALTGGEVMKIRWFD
jgi:hypothetical protein